MLTPTGMASVLAVDDNATIRKAISMRLGARGFSVTTAQSGSDALRLVDTAVFDLVLLDLHMPDMRGDEVLRRLRTRFSETELPVIMLAASDDQRDITKTLELGANDYVIKPGDLPVLIARIKTQLSLKHTIKELKRMTHDPDIDADIHRLEATCRDPSQLKRELAKLYHTYSGDSVPYRQMFDAVPVSCLILNEDGEILSANRLASEFFGCSKERLTQKSICDLYPEDNRTALHQFLATVLGTSAQSHRLEVRHRLPDGAVIWVRATARLVRQRSGDAHVVMTCEDIDETYRLTKKISHQATHDELTGLANRKSLEARLRQVLESAVSEQTEHTLAYLDLDQFKIINDTCGHMAGDRLIQEVARLLKVAVRKRDTLARMGGDEFAVLLEDCPLQPAIESIDAMRRAISAYKFVWDNKHHNISASIGVVPVNAQCSDVGTVLSMADTACYAAKDSGRDRIHVYQPDDDTVAARHGEMRWVTRIKEAIAEDRFELNFQLIKPLGPDTLGEHYELLVRMRDERGKIIMPGEFFPAAERYNLTEKIDRWVIKQTLRWFRENPEELDSLHLCAINLSGQSMGNEDLLQYILDELSDQTIPPHKFCFEVTETAAISNLVSATRFISLLKERGFLFALDDFGSGFSSFSYLKNLPVDFLKIDGSFVRDINRDSIDYAMVRSINEIGHVMQKKTIAEFVEDDAILATLREVGVDYAQGYAIGKPKPLTEKIRSSRVLASPTLDDDPVS